jgi:hypothetical protein
MKESKSRPAGRLGSVLVTTVLFLPVLISFAIGSIDVGYLNTEKSRMQTVADMAVVSALGNVAWNDTTAETEKVEITSNINAFLTVNGYNPALFGTPQFEVDGENVTKVTLESLIPVKTFFWSFISPGSDRLNVNIHSAAEVEYDENATTPAPDFGLYAFNDLTLRTPRGKGAKDITVSSYDSTDSSPTNYYDLKVGAGNNADLDNRTFIGDVYADTITDGGTVYGDVVVDDVSSSSLPTVYDRVEDDGTGTYDSTYITANSPAGTVTESTLSKPEYDLPSEAELLARTGADAVITAADLFAEGKLDHSSSIGDEGYSIPNHTDLILEAGKTYWFPDDFKFTTTEKIIIEPADSTEGVTIYSDSSFTGSGHFDTFDTRLKIVNIWDGTDEEDRPQFKFTGQSDVYIDFFGPNCNVDFKGNADVWGRVYAHDIYVDGDFLYDKNLNSLGLEWAAPPEVLTRAHLVE